MYTEKNHGPVRGQNCPATHGVSQTQKYPTCSSHEEYGRQNRCTLHWCGWSTGPTIGVARSVHGRTAQSKADETGDDETVRTTLHRKMLPLAGVTKLCPCTRQKEKKKAAMRQVPRLFAMSQHAAPNAFKCHRAKSQAIHAFLGNERCQYSAVPHPPIPTVAECTLYLDS